MAYDPHTWNTQEPITKTKMQHIEDGIADVDAFSTTNINQLKTYIGNLEKFAGQDSHISDFITNLEQAIGYSKQDINNGGSIAQRIQNISFNSSQVDQNTTNVSKLLSIINNACGSQSIDQANLQAILETIRLSVSSVDTAYKAADTALDGRVTTAQTTANTAIDAINTAKGSADSLAQRINNIETTNNTQGLAIGTLQDRLNAPVSGDSNNLEQHISNINSHIDDIESEIETARGTDSLNVARQNLNARFVDDEARIAAAEGRLTTVENATTSTIPNRISSAEGRIGTVEGKVTEITNAHRDENDTLDARFDDIESELTSAKDTYNSIDARFDAVESTASTASTAVGGISTRVATLEGTVNDATTGLAATKVIADAAKAKADTALQPADITTLSNDVETLKGKDTIIIGKTSITYGNDGVPTNIGQTPTADADYLLQNTDDKYYYWRYINNTWQLISGGADGGGTSSAEFYAEFPNTPSETVDYFIGSDRNYIHYRYYNNQWVQILPAHLINSAYVDTTRIGEENNAPRKSRPIITEVGSDTNLLAGFNAIQSFDAVATDNGYKLTWINIDGDMRDITITGGSGGSSSNVNAFISYGAGASANITTIANQPCEINYIYSVTERVNGTDEIISTPGSGVWSVNGARVATQEVTVNDITDENDYNTFDIGPYLRTGANSIVLSVTNTINGETIRRTKTWQITVINFSLTWEYEESTINSGETINFSCTPYGADITKTLYLKVGDYQQSQTVTSSSTPVTVSLTNNFSHGSYTAEMWMTATINGVLRETTPHIKHDFIVAEVGNNTPIIAATLPSSTASQYDTVSIPFVVYSPTSLTSSVTLSDNGVVQDTRTDINRNTQTWNYTPSTLGTDIVYDDSTPPKPISGTHVLTITSGETTKTLILTVNSVDINNKEVGGYIFKLKANELASNNALQNWHYDNSNINATKLQFSNNFDWINGGIKTEYDDNGQLRQYIRVKSGTTMTIPYQMFATDPKRTGNNFKIIFKVENCRNYDAVVATAMTNNVGIQLNAHNAVFKSTTTQVSTQYGENEYTELEFEVYKNHIGDTEVEAANPYMMAWIDGVITSARPYDGNFVQNANIIIGSNDCDVCVYLVKYYPTVLTIAEHVANFIADAPNAAEMIRRYTRNNILDGDGDIDWQALADKNPDCRVWLYEMSRMTTGKKDYVAGVNFQQIYKNGTTYQNGLHGKGTLTVQGTSSVNYRKGAANTDINFYDTKDGRLAYCELFDGEENDLLYDVVNGENVVKPVNERGFKINTDSIPITYSNMKVNFASCEQVNNMCNAEWYQQFQPYPSLSPRDCMEFAMGVQFICDKGEGEAPGEVRLFNEKTNRKDNKYYMYSIGNLGTSKKNTHIFHSDNECCIEVNNNENAGCRMISVPSDLQADYTAYQNENYASMTNYDWSGKTSGKDHSYGMRFPDTENPDKEIKAGWARFVKWMADNNPGAALAPNYVAAELPEPVDFEPYTFKGHKRNGIQVLQGVTVSQYAGHYTHDTFEYRMAKMLSECEDYMAMDSVVYHFLFIERHTMVDNVSKNTFWSAAKTNQYINGVEQEDTEGYWIWDLSKNYDNDTSDGNNNEGQLIFDYGNEAADMQDGKAVFNASDAVWFVFVSNLYEACQAMFQNREAATSKNGKWTNAWNSTAYHNYLLSEQRKVPERVWNQCYWYDYLRTYESGKVREESDTGEIIDKSWITFLDGGQKIHQRQHYETFEGIYDASKYRSNQSTSNAITLRGYTPAAGDPSLAAVPAKSEISIKMYNKCYLTAHFGDNIQTQKVSKGVLTTLQFLDNGNYMTLKDTVINIDTAPMIQEIGDLAPLYPGQASFSAATRLRSIKIGDSAQGYNNPHITNTETGTVDFGANYMLEHLEVQNLSNANQPLDLSGCPALTYLDARGSSFTSIKFANGGLLNEAYINNPNNLVMRNLDFLTNANFSITDPTAIEQLRLEGCRLFNTRTFIESLTNLNILRLTNINWTVNDDEHILDSLLNIMGMDELGYTISQSYLSGYVSLTGVVYSGVRDRYISAWPELEVDTSHASQLVAQHLVTYMDENGENVLYTKYINSGDSIVDIVATNEYSTPTKAADIQYRYTFGSLQYGSYIPYSGWRYSADSQSIYATYGAEVPKITGRTTVCAVYSTTPQQYVVRWLVDNRVVSTTDPQNYGGGYNLSAPTIKEVKAEGIDTYSFQDNGDGTCNYRIMTGWEKLPTNIQPTSATGTYDISATWLERSNININQMLASNDYSIEEKLLVLKNIQSARSTLAIQDEFPIKMGYPGTKPAIDLLSTPKRYTGTADAAINAYTPFAAGTSFTMAIDYRFEQVINDQASEAVLASCYDDSGTTTVGFKLFYNPRTSSSVPQISFGSTNSISSENVKTIGKNLQYRGMVVLRHRAGEPTLYIYSGSNSEGTIVDYSVNTFRQAVTLPNFVPSNAKIILGGVNSSSTTSINAQGTIYAVKYWEEDLGEGECVQLANWCYETAHFAVQDFNGQKTHSILPLGNANLVLHTLNASEFGTAKDVAIVNTEQAVGWDPSLLRTFYNGRLYQALPIKLQSIINLTPILHIKANHTNDGYEISQNNSTTQDYVFASSYKEAFNNITAYNGETGGSSAFNWGGLTIKQWSNGGFITQSDPSGYINLRFPYRPIAIGSSTQVFVNYSASNGSFEAKAIAGNSGFTLNTGDILIPEESLTAYMYISGEDVQKGAPFVRNSSNVALQTSAGAWIESSSWWLRSVSTDALNNPGIQSNRTRFTFVSALGSAATGRTYENGIVYSIAL